MKCELKDEICTPYFQLHDRGQLISKGLFGVILMTKKTNEILKRVPIKKLYNIIMFNSP